MSQHSKIVSKYFLIHYMYSMLCLLLVKISVILELTHIPISQAPPPSNYLSSAVYDPVKDRILTYGGADASSSTLISSMNSFSLATNSWESPIPIRSPITTALSSHKLYLRSDQKILIFFGVNSQGISSDVFSFDLNTYRWNSEILTGDPLSGRINFGFTSFVYIDCSYIAIFGGLSVEGMNNDLFL